MTQKNIDHYEVSLNSGENLRVHYNNVKPDLQKKTLKNAAVNGITVPSSGIAQALHNKFSKTQVVYRRMADAEVKSAIQRGGLPGPMRGTNNRKYITESLTKATEFRNNVLTPAQQNQDKILKMYVDKNGYQGIRGAAINQQGASKINPTADVYNYEGIKAPKMNLGIHKKNLGQFNETVKDVVILNPKSPMVKNRFLRYLSTNKLKCGMVALSVVIEATTITLSIIEDGGRIGKSTTCSLSSLAGSLAGAQLGAMLGSIVPGIGNVIGGLVGAILGGLIGGEIGRLFCLLFPPPTAPGNGPPETEYIAFIYGLPDCEFHNSDVYGAPSTGYETEVYGAPRVEYAGSSFGAPKTYYEDF